MTDNITLPREVVEKIREAWSSEVYPPAASIEWYDIMDALRAALAAALAEPEQKPEPEQYPEKGPALTVYNEIAATDDPGSPLERLRFFCSLAMRPQDWLDVAPFFDALSEPQPEPRITRITCGFVDVRFDGERWRCGKCGERMNEYYEEMVKHSSGKDYLELMQRKAERFHGITKEDKT